MFGRGGRNPGFDVIQGCPWSGGGGLPGGFEIPGMPGSNRDVQWDMLPETDMIDGYDKEKSTFENVLFHVELPARGKDGKAEKQIRKLHIKFRNEW